MSDYSFMKSGFELDESSSSLSPTDNAMLLSTLTVYLQEAMKIAEAFTLYKNENNIKSEYLIKSLKTQALVDTGFWEKDETKTRLHHEFKYFSEHPITLNDDKANVTDKDSDNTEDNDSESESESELDFIPPSITEEEYKRIDEIDTVWSQWNPTDDLNIILKKGIENTIRKINLDLVS